MRPITVFATADGKRRKRIVGEVEIYRTGVLPDFELPLVKRLSVADRWKDGAPTVQTEIRRQDCRMNRINAKVEGVVASIGRSSRRQNLIWRGALIPTGLSLTTALPLL